MTLVKLVVGAVVLGAAALVVAQEAPVRVWGVRVLATDVEALEGVPCEDLRPSEVAHPVNSATTTEVILNVGATPDMARKATTAPHRWRSRSPTSDTRHGECPF